MFFYVTVSAEAKGVEKEIAVQASDYRCFVAEPLASRAADGLTFV